MGLTVQNVTIDLEDRGFYDLMLQMTAAESGQPLPATRTALSGMAQGMTLAVLGTDATALAAVGRDWASSSVAQNSKARADDHRQGWRRHQPRRLRCAREEPHRPRRQGHRHRHRQRRSGTGDRSHPGRAPEPAATDTEQEKRDLKAAAPTQQSHALTLRSRSSWLRSPPSSTAASFSLLSSSLSGAQ